LREVLGIAVGDKMLVNIHKVDLFIKRDREADTLMSLVKIDNIPRVRKIIKGGDGLRRTGTFSRQRYRD
jgi:hypothetical protein